MDELSQLDDLIESDILDALGQDSETITNNDESQNAPETIQEDDTSVVIEDIEKESIITTEDTKEVISSTMKSDDLASLLGQLLNNKTIEITIKIKD